MFANMGYLLFSCCYFYVWYFPLCVCVCVYWTLQRNEPGGHFICTVYVEEKKETTERHVQVTWSSTNDTT